MAQQQTQATNKFQLTAHKRVVLIKALSKIHGQHIPKWNIIKR